MNDTVVRSKPYNDSGSVFSEACHGLGQGQFGTSRIVTRESALQDIHTRRVVVVQGKNPPGPPSIGVVRAIVAVATLCNTVTEADQERVRAFGGNSIHDWWRHEVVRDRRLWFNVGDNGNGADGGGDWKVGHS